MIDSWILESMLKRPCVSGAGSIGASGVNVSERMRCSPCVAPHTLRPILPPACRYHPTCSDYALEALKMAIADAGESEASAHIPNGVLTVPTELWRRYALKRSMEMDPHRSDDARRMAFKRSATILQARDLVARWNDRVWIVGG